MDVWLAFSAIGSCRQIVGVESRAVYDSGAPLVCSLPASASQTCDACVMDKCCAEAQQCADTAGCGAIEACQHACASGDTACLVACAGKSSLAEQVQAIFRVCRDTLSCAQACRAPDPWSCVGKVKWQLQDPTTSSITITGQVIGPSNQPIVGATVALCADPICRFPSASGDSDAEGRVALNLLLTSASSGTPLYLQVHATGFVDELLTLATPPPYFDYDAGQLYPTAVDLLDPFYALAGVARDPSRTTLLASGVDCQGFPAGLADGFTFALPDAEEGATIAYLSADPVGNVAFSQTPNGSSAAFIFNAPVPLGGITPHLLRIEARLGTTLLSSTSVAVRTDALSTVALAPTP